MLQNLTVNGFNWVIEIFQFNEDFIKIYHEDSKIRYLLKLMFNILKIYINYTMIYHFCLKE